MQATEVFTSIKFLLLVYCNSANPTAYTYLNSSLSHAVNSSPVQSVNSGLAQSVNSGPAQSVNSGPARVVN